MYGGYEGCVGEEGYYPCRQESTGISGLRFNGKRPLVWDGEQCVETDSHGSTRTYWLDYRGRSAAGYVPERPSIHSKLTDSVFSYLFL